MKPFFMNEVTINSGFSKSSLTFSRNSALATFPGGEEAALS